MDKRRSPRTRPICPNCGSDNATPIMYGLPTSEGFSAAERGEVVLGGCIVFDEASAWQCQACHEGFGSIVEWETSGSSYDQALRAIFAADSEDSENGPARERTSD